MNRLLLILAILIVAVGIPGSALAGGLAPGVVLNYANLNRHFQDRHRNLFVSDSYAEPIKRVAPGGSVSNWSADPLLLPAPEFPFGANGVTFDRDQKFLYVANTSTRRIIRIPVLADGSAGSAEIFADGTTLNAREGSTDALVRADGIMFDVAGNLYVCANLSTEIQVVSPDGSAIIHRYTGSGANAFDFDASLVFKGQSLYISNLSLFDGGANSKVSVMGVPLPGLPLRP